MNTYYIFKKEMRNYFNSSIPYVFFIFFLLLVGFFFFVSMIRYSEISMFATRNPQLMRNFSPREAILAPHFLRMGFLLIFLIPVISMRLFSEEKKLGTIELLFTYPITDWQLVMGKFLAAAVVILIIFIFSFSYMVVYNRYFTSVPWGVVGSGYLGLLLLTTSFLSLGMWISSLTSDQVTSALATVSGILIFWIIGWGETATSGVLATVLKELSLSDHFRNFAQGTEVKYLL